MSTIESDVNDRPGAAGLSRRRLLVGTAAGTAAIWAAPTLTSLAPKAVAGSAGPKVFTDDFEEENVPAGSFNTYSAGQSFDGKWMVTSGSIDVIHNFYNVSNQQGQAVDMDGTSAGTIETIQSFPPTATGYTLTLDLAKNPDSGADTITVTLGGTPSTPTPLVAATTSYQTLTATFPAGSSGTLTIASDNPGNAGALLDNVVLRIT